MTVHDLHDALNLLPSDLITAADKVRTAPKAKVIPWKRFAAMAALLTMVLGTALIFDSRMYSYVGDVKLESAVAEAPAAMAPPMEHQITADEALPEPPVDVGMSEIPAEEATGDVNGMEEELDIDHSHRFAEETEERSTTAAYCGNTVTILYLDEMNYTLAGSDSVKITDILTHLEYDPEQICRCMTELTVDTETQTGIQVNLTEAFARCELGQAALTEEKVEIIRSIVNGLE